MDVAHCLPPEEKDGANPHPPWYYYDNAVILQEGKGSDFWKWLFLALYGYAGYHSRMGRPPKKKKRSRMANRVRSLRARLEESTEVFGERFCRSARTVEDWELGRRSPDPLVITMIARLEDEL
jgi:hypothetical protein